MEEQKRKVLKPTKRLSTLKISHSIAEMREHCSECKRMKWQCTPTCPVKTGVWDY